MLTKTELKIINHLHAYGEVKLYNKRLKEVLSFYSIKVSMDGLLLGYVDPDNPNGRIRYYTLDEHVLDPIELEDIISEYKSQLELTIVWEE